MTDKDLVLTKLNDLSRYVAKLEGLKKYSLQDLENDLEKVWAVKHGLQLAIQVTIDIGHHILADIGESRIENYADVIDKLGERHILPTEFVKDIKGMIGLRNVLVHEYVLVDLSKIYHILHNWLEDFRKFAGYIEKHLGREESEGV